MAQRNDRSLRYGAGFRSASGVAVRRQDRIRHLRSQPTAAQSRRREIGGFDPGAVLLAAFGHAGAPVVDRIIEVLRTEVSRAEIAEIVQQVDNTVTQFVALLVKEETRQAEEKEKEKKKEDGKNKETVITDKQCKS